MFISIEVGGDCLHRIHSNKPPRNLQGNNRCPPPGVSTLEGQNWKLQFPGMKLVSERWNGACFGKPCLQGNRHWFHVFSSPLLGGRVFNNDQYTVIFFQSGWRFAASPESHSWVAVVELHLRVLCVILERLHHIDKYVFTVVLDRYLIEILPTIPVTNGD